MNHREEEAQNLTTATDHTGCVKIMHMLLDYRPYF